MPLHALTQHRGIDVRVEGHKGLAKEAGKGRHWIDNAYFGTGELAGVAHQEPQHSLVRGQFGDGW